MYKLYSRLADRETVLELWGGSTKHPDITFTFSDYLDKVGILGKRALTAFDICDFIAYVGTELHPFNFKAKFNLWGLATDAFKLIMGFEGF